MTHVLTPAERGARLAHLVEAAALPPLGLDVLETLAADLLEEELGLQEDVEVEGPVEARTKLARILGAFLDSLEEPGDRRFLVSTSVLALLVLAVAHQLPGIESEPCDVAREIAVGFREKPVVLAALGPRIRRWLGDLRDQTVLDDGRAGWIREVRRELGRLESLRPGTLDVLPRKRRLLIGGRQVAYRVRADIKGTRLRPIRASSKIGRLLLLAVIGEAIELPASLSHVVSRAKNALAIATRHRIRLERRHGRYVTEPPLRLTARAEAVARALPPIP